MLTRIIKLAAITTIFLALHACQENTGLHNAEFETIHILRDAQAPDSTETLTAEEILVESGAVEQDSI
tara:strand:+ start:501 stop:704 length:204 start_codon:yes stop_codon:yes gene_type:complete